MSLPWTEIAAVDTPDGRLALRRRNDRDWLITIDGRVLMNSVDHRSEAALGTLGCRGLENKPAPRILLGGLGMGITLRAMLDVLPASAVSHVAELNPDIVAWCRGPLAPLTHSAVDDPRVKVTIGDFADALQVAAEDPGRLDAIIIDLYVGPDHATRDSDPLYGARACQRAHAALCPGGVFAIWAEAFHESYAGRLRQAGFRVTHENPARGSRRFVVYLATKPAK